MGILLIVVLILFLKEINKKIKSVQTLKQRRAVFFAVVFVQVCLCAILFQELNTGKFSPIIVVCSFMFLLVAHFGMGSLREFWTSKIITKEFLKNKREVEVFLFKNLGIEKVDNISLIMLENSIVWIVDFEDKKFVIPNQNSTFIVLERKLLDESKLIEVSYHEEVVDSTLIIFENK